MLTNMRGRVEADPMRIPAPLRLNSTGSQPFAAVLEQTARRAPAEHAVPTAPPAGSDASSDEPLADETAELPRAGREQVDADPEPRSDAGTDERSPHSQAAAPEVTETLRRGEPERHQTAGKGPDSPRASHSDVATERVLVALSQQAGQDRGVVAAPANQGVAAIAATKAGDAPVRGFDAGWARPSTPTRAPAVAPGYRTDNAASAQLLEHARDSVFKQILMQLNGDGGEMRVRLQPPDLGELDLRLVVEHGNKLTLTIGAERADVTALLHKHLDELKQTLQAAGLEVTDAQVHQRDAGAARDDGAFGSRERRRLRDEAAATTEATTTLRRSYVTAEGLDFWA